MAVQARSVQHSRKKNPIDLDYAFFDFFVGAANVAIGKSSEPSVWSVGGRDLLKPCRFGAVVGTVGAAFEAVGVVTFANFAGGGMLRGPAASVLPVANPASSPVSSSCSALTPTKGARAAVEVEACSDFTSW